jgi:hypothetical protein
MLPLPPQALRSKRLEHLQLPESFVAGSPEVFAGFLSPSLVSLVSLSSNISLPLSADAIQACFPAPLPLKSLDIAYSCHRSVAEASVALALPLLCERLPALTHLTLRPDHISTVDIGLSQPSASEGPDLPPPPVPVLAALSSLQQLHISGSVMVAGVAASLPLLPALTRLQLGGMMPPEQASVLASLSGLRCLHLHGRYDDAAWTYGTLAAIGQMLGLTELVLERRLAARVLGHKTHNESCEELPFRLLELPFMLRRLVVAGGASLREALRIFGGSVDEICSMGGGVAADR